MIASQPYSTVAPCRNSSPDEVIRRPRALLLVSGLADSGILAAGLKEIVDVMAIKNTAEAMRLLEARIVHLVVVEDCDNNYDLCSHVRQSSQYAYIPVLVVIPRDSFSARLRWLRAGADACLEMPVSRPYLLAQVDNLLVNRARLRAQFETADLSWQETGGPGPGDDGVLWWRLNQAILQQLPNAALNVSQLARELHMSRPTLYRKITEISKMTPAALITRVRLDRAASLLASTGYPVTEISRMVGFCTRNGLGKAFTKRFGVSPSEYRRKVVL